MSLSPALALSVLLGIAPTAALADEITVPGDFPTIQAAITAAADGDEIVVAPGIYTGTINPFGKAITIRSIDPDDPAVVEQTILDGKGDRVVAFFSGERLDTVLDGFTISGGQADEGGGIRIFASDPIVRRCVIRANEAVRGGGVFFSTTSAWFDRCVFEHNVASDDGGAVLAYAGTSVRFDGCRFTGNEAASDGGAVSSTFSSLRFQGCVFAGNTAGQKGGEYDSDNSIALFVSSLLRDNAADLGGALALLDDSARLLNTTVVRNTAATTGGAIYGIMVQPLIRNAIVRDNEPDVFGGFAVNPAAEYSNVSGGLDGPGNIDADPQFADPAADDFRLQSGSPSVNTGFNGWVPSYALRDLDHRPRLLEEKVDMGAFEFQVAVPPPPTVTGDLVAAVRDDGALAFGLESPLLRYDVDEDAWFEIVRNLPAYAIAADPDRRCFWVHSGENGMLGRVPYDTLELEEIGVLKFDGSPSFGLSGMAVRDGVVYGSVWRVGLSPDRLHTVNTETATLELVAEFPPDFEVWDLHYDTSSDRMLVLSSPETIPPGPLGIYELDLDTFELTEVQRYVNDDPFSELNSLQGLAVGAGKTFIFRSPYNKLEVFDATTGDLVTIAQVPDSVERPGAGWLWGGLTWAPITPPADITGDGTVGFTDLLALLAAWGPCAGCPADLDGDGIVGFTDLLELLASWT